jgi:hypothetical protein
MKLAADGYTVYSAEFYAKDMHWFKNIFDSSLFRRFAFCERKLRHPAEYAFYANDFSTNLAQEYNTFVTLIYQGVSLRSIQNETVILAGDEISQKALPIAFKQNKKLLDGTFNVAFVDRYTAGFGPIEQTDPLLALFLGRQRDSTMYISAHIAHAVEKAVSRFTTKQRAAAKRLAAMTASASTATETQQTDQGTGAATTPDNERPSPGNEKYSINTDENDAESTVLPAAPNTATTTATESPTTENTAVTPETPPSNTNTTASDQPENSVTTE